MKTATKIVLTLSMALGTAGCDRYWQEAMDASWPQADTDDVWVGRHPLPPTPPSHKNTIKSDELPTPPPLPPMPTNPHKSNLANSNGPDGDPGWSPHVSER